MTTPAFDFLARPSRAVKLRKQGVSVVNDKVKSLSQAGD